MDDNRKSKINIEDVTRENSSYKKGVRYRLSLFILLLFFCVLFMYLLWEGISKEIPSKIYLVPDRAQSIGVDLPATGEIMPVDSGMESNIPKSAIHIDLKDPIVMGEEKGRDFNMQVKLFGFLPVKKVNICLVPEKQVIPVGIPVGIYLKAEGIVVVGTGDFVNDKGQRCNPAKGCLKSGDYILKINGSDVQKKRELMEAVKASEGREMTFCVKRDQNTFEIKIKPEKGIEGEYKLGLWVRDNAQGVGTMTYVDNEGHFGALGHGINDVDTTMLLQVGSGSLYDTEIKGITKGENGKPGEMTGRIVYKDEHILGEITDNSFCGIYGVCNERGMGLITGEPVEIGYKQNIIPGPAQILCTVEDKPEYFDILIEKVNLDHDNVNRGIELKVTDSKLLEKTGGIIQGMSGSPIIQNGKLIGAVTHVFIHDPTKGYGIFIESMLDQGK